MRPLIRILLNSCLCTLTYLLSIGCVNGQIQLDIEHTYVSDSSFNPGEVIMAKCVIKNVGDQILYGDTLSFIDYYLSKDAVHSPEDIKISFDSIHRGAQFDPATTWGPIHHVMIIPADIVPGAYHLLLRFRYPRQSKLWNINIRTQFLSKPIQIRAFPKEGPDLTGYISDFGTNKLGGELVHPGSVIHARSYINNSGTEMTEEGVTTFAWYMICPGVKWDPEKAVKVGGESMAYTLAPSTRHERLDENLQMPKDLSEGTYSLWYWVDPNDQIDEIHEDNNLRLFGTFQVEILWYKQRWAVGLFYLLSLLALCLIAWEIYRRIQIRKRLRIKAEEARRAKEMEQFKSQFYTNITHEFRTPLTIIQGVAELLPPEATHLRQMIYRNSQHLLRLVNQMLDLAKIESGNLQPKYALGDVIPFIRYLLSSFESWAENKGISLSFQSDLEYLEMDFDKDKLQDIISNLLSNAIKFTPKDGSIFLRLSRSADMLVCEVEDSGMGIPQDQLPHIFNRFYQVDGSSSRENEGTGIGLALVKELVQLHGGEISASSETNQGSCFRLSLPIHQEAPMMEIYLWELEEPLPSFSGPVELSSVNDEAAQDAPDRLGRRRQ